VKIIDMHYIYYIYYIYCLKKTHKLKYTGTHVDLNPSVHFMDEDMFSDPTKHMPERWLRDEGEKEIHPYLLTPFGHGTRMCAGRRFAEQDLYTVLARIIARYELEIENERVGQIYHTLLFPDQNLNIKFKDRK